VTLNRALSAGNTNGPITDAGARRYELTNHLGNVPITFSETTVTHTDGQGNEYTAPQILSHQDYTAFGLEWHRTPGLAGADEKYRYAFNGKEQDTQSEWGDLTHYDYGFRIYNPAIAKFLSVDPLSAEYPWYTPYQFAGNKPIYAIDLDGLEELPYYKSRYKVHNGMPTFELVWKSYDNLVGLWYNGVAGGWNYGVHKVKKAATAGPAVAISEIESDIDDRYRSSKRYVTNTSAEKFAGDFETVVTDPAFPEQFTTGVLSLGLTFTKVGRLPKREVEFFGGENGFIPTALNVDIVAQTGFKGTIAEFAKEASRRGLNGTIDRIIASGPQALFLDEASQLLKPGGEIVINSSKGNKFGKIPSVEKLQELGLEVIQEAGELLDEFQGQVFRRTNGSEIPKESIKTTILRKL